MDPVRQIADAVLYEGYILWPYRRGALKNQRRWTFGGVFPAAWSEQHDDDPCVMRTECLLESDPGAAVDVRVRFLHVVERRVAQGDGEARRWVDDLVVAGERHVAWEEAAEREVGATVTVPASGEAWAYAAIDVPAGAREQGLREPDGRRAGAVVRSWEPLAGVVTVLARHVEPGLTRLVVRVVNATPASPQARPDALRQTFCSTHTVLEAPGGSFVSLTDPPAHLAEAAAGCRNEGTWPVLVGEASRTDTMLSSPIILEDHPRIAPESPGDLFDGGEIDQLLTLSILSMTDEEKREMRESDPRAREILDRTESLSEEELMRLHGAIREFAAVREP